VSQLHEEGVVIPQVALEPAAVLIEALLLREPDQGPGVLAAEVGVLALLDLPRLTEERHRRVAGAG
jgi:hypothetical protein